MDSIIITSKVTKNTPLATNKLLKDLYERTSTLRFGLDIEENLF